ncbi:hypothetical protein BHM03_00048603, partial [Ensete ventricosum]
RDRKRRSQQPHPDVLSPARLDLPVLLDFSLLLSLGVAPCPPLRSFASSTFPAQPSPSPPSSPPPSSPATSPPSSEFRSFLSAAADGEPAVDRQSDAAAILYSSGITARVKGAVLTQRNLIASMASAVPESAVLMVTVPLFHAYGFLFCLKAVAVIHTESPHREVRCEEGTSSSWAASDRQHCWCERTQVERMGSRTASKDIITLRGSAAIVSEFFGTTSPLPSDGMRRTGKQTDRSPSSSSCCVRLGRGLDLETRNCSILYNRGIYPEESFTKVKKYGLPMLLTQDEGVKSFISGLTSQLTGHIRGPGEMEFQHRDGCGGRREGNSEVDHITSISVSSRRRVTKKS